MARSKFQYFLRLFLESIVFFLLAGEERKEFIIFFPSCCCCWDVRVEGGTDPWRERDGALLLPVQLIVSRDEGTFSCIFALFALYAVSEGKANPFLKCSSTFFFVYKLLFILWLPHDRWLFTEAGESGIRFHDAMMMKRRFQVKMGAQQYHQTASHPRDVQTRSDRELVFLLQKDPSQRTVHVSHFQLDAFTHLFHGRPDSLPAWRHKCRFLYRNNGFSKGRKTNTQTKRLNLFCLFVCVSTTRRGFGSNDSDHFLLNHSSRDH